MSDKTQAAASADEFLSFTLGEEHYGVDIRKFRKSAATTRSPACPTPPTTSRA